MSLIRGGWLVCVGLCAGCAPAFLSAEELTWWVPMPEVAGVQSFIVWRDDRVVATSTDWALSWHVSNATPTHLTLAAYSDDLDTLQLRPGDLAAGEQGRSCALLKPRVVLSGKVQDSGFSGWAPAEPRALEERLSALVGDRDPRCLCPKIESKSFRLSGRGGGLYEAQWWHTAWIDPGETVLIKHLTGWSVLDTRNQLAPLVDCEETPSWDSNVAALGNRHFATMSGGDVILFRVDPAAGRCEPIGRLQLPSPGDGFGGLGYLVGQMDPLELWTVSQGHEPSQCRVARYREGAFEELAPVDCPPPRDN